MKNIISFLLTCFVFSGCYNDQRAEVMARMADEVVGENYPLLIDDGTKLVYQFGHMTADKGLKLYGDTISYPASSFLLPDSIKLQLINP